MKGVTLWEPSASLMDFGLKKIETRSWKTFYRGPLLIHAAVKKVERGYAPMLLRRAGVKPPPDWPMHSYFPYGCVLAIVDLVDCVETERLSPGTPERFFGDYSPGRFGWVTANLRRIRPVIPWKGAQGLWDVPPQLREKIDA
jgi:hypothetical protein